MSDRPSFTYEEISAYCFEVYSTKRAELPRYETTDDAPGVALEAWNFPVTPLIKFIHVDGWKSPIFAELTVEGESSALSYGDKKNLLPPELYNQFKES